MSRAVMTIHGFLTDTKDFGRLYDYLDFYDEVVACEVPGHNGKVDFSLFTVEGTIVAVTACYDRLRARHDEVDVVGFSMGGALASYLCAVRDVHRCVMLAPANKYLNPRFVLDAIKYYSTFQRTTYKSASGKLHEKVAAVKEGMRPYRRNMAVCLKLEFDRILPNLTMYTYKVFSKLMKTVNKTLDNSAKPTTPSLIIRGNLDELVPKKSVDYLIERFENCQTHIIEDIGHGLLHTNRDNALIAKIVEFLSCGKIIPDVPFRHV